MAVDEAGEPEGRAGLFLGAGALSLALFLIVSAQVATRTGLAAVDAPLSSWAVATSTLGTGSALFAAAAGSNRLILPLALVVGAWAWHRGHKRDALLVIGLLVATQAFAHGLKLVFALPRPDVQWLASAGSSYPSGHSANGAYAGALIAWYGQRRFRGAKWPLVAGAAWAVVVAWGRMLAGVHYLSDVIGGLALGATLACTALPLATLPATISRRIPVGLSLRIRSRNEPDGEAELETPAAQRKRPPPPPPSPA